tara:strand:- start:869 stop:1033 length:165 start_codon:yes stop_codon:yes gene_type:complete
LEDFAQGRWPLEDALILADLGRGLALEVSSVEEAEGAKRIDLGHLSSWVSGSSW